jgi:pantothenate kinase
VVLALILLSQLVAAQAVEQLRQINHSLQLFLIQERLLQLLGLLDMQAAEILQVVQVVLEFLQVAAVVSQP